MPADVTIVMTAAEGASDSRLDRRRRDLEADLRRVRGVTVAPVPRDAPEGTKTGLAQHIGMLVVSGLTSGAAIAAVATVIVAAVKRSTAGSITLRRGDTEIAATGLSPKEVAKHLTELVEEDE